LTLPLLVVLLPVAMLSTYAVTDSVARGIRDSQINELIAATHALNERAVALGDILRREAERAAFTQGVPSFIQANNSAALAALLRPLAAAGDLDYLIVGSDNGREVVGLEHSGNAYRISQGTLLNQLGFVDGILSGGQASTSGIVRTTDGYGLFAAVPVQRRGVDSQLAGVAVTGIRLARALGTLRDTDLSQVALFGPKGELLDTTFAADQAGVVATLKDIGPRLLASAGSVTVINLQSGETQYQAAYLPFVNDGQTLGILALLRPNTLWVATDRSRQTLSLAFSAAAGGVLIVAFIGVSLTVRRLEHITRTARALAAGDMHARTGLDPGDEVSELGRAIDVYAQRVQKRHDALEALLREQRGESARLMAVLEAIPDGIIVQDLDSRVVLMNDHALILLGSQRVFRSSPLNELTAIVTDTLGAALAPGIYSLGDPQRVPLDGRVLHAQAAAILSTVNTRIGTVIVLRDITEEVQREQAREALLAQMAREARPPLPAASKHPEDTLQLFVQEINRNAIALQRMITEIRELSTFDARSVQQSQQALSAESLVWHVASEWQPTAQAARISLHVVVLRRGLLVLGEERRLRWAIGNLVDNALKYTQARGHVTLMLTATDDEKYAQLSISDTGVGISDHDLPHVFTRFYRGKPLARNGQVIQTPGSGQGLFVARRVIEAHGGLITLTSTPGRGTEVTFTLPLTASVQMDLSGTQTGTVPGSQPLEVKRKHQTKE
jgi:signal transduction histidine kinase/HAMP domain-containing protein